MQVCKQKVLSETLILSVLLQKPIRNLFFFFWRGFKQRANNGLLVS